MVSIAPPPPPTSNTIYWLLVAFCLPVFALIVESFKALLAFAAKVVDKPPVELPDNVKPIGGRQDTSNSIDAVDCQLSSHDSRISNNAEAIGKNEDQILDIWKTIAKK